jgi:hypothetical protein
MAGNDRESTLRISINCFAQIRKALLYCGIFLSLLADYWTELARQGTPANAWEGGSCALQGKSSTHLSLRDDPWSAWQSHLVISRPSFRNTSGMKAKDT